jgi:chromate reductase, NAD(P)H dehydrogenase (quinone)
LPTAVTGTARILGVSGSLQANSTNTGLLRVARDRAAGGVEVVLFGRLAEIPPFAPDVEPAPAVVVEWRELVSSSDAVLFATPEYAHGLPGVLKNALDWLVGSGDLYGKRVAILSAEPSAQRAAHARADLERTLRAQGADVVGSETIAVPTSARGHEADDPDVIAGVRAALEALTGDAGAGPSDPAPARRPGSPTGQ